MNGKRYGAVAAGIIALGIMIAGFGAGATAHMQTGTPDASPMAGGHDHGHGDAHGDSMNMSTGAAYMTITNDGEEVDVLLSIETDAADVVEIHEVTMTGDVMAMSPLHDGLEIPAGEAAVFEQGGYHLMLVGLTGSLISGESYEMTLTFENAGDVTITVPVLRSEPEDGEGLGDTAEAGDITIEGAWSRQAPKLDGSIASPVASPAATPEA